MNTQSDINSQAGNTTLFYQMPKALFIIPRYRDLSPGAKLLYCIMKDRARISSKNNWVDERGKVYIYFTLTDIQLIMPCSRTTAVKLLAELDKAELIERKKSGYKKPSMIFVNQVEEGGIESYYRQRNKDGNLIRKRCIDNLTVHTATSDSSNICTAMDINSETDMVHNSNSNNNEYNNNKYIYKEINNIGSKSGTVNMFDEETGEYRDTFERIMKSIAQYEEDDLYNY